MTYPTGGPGVYPPQQQGPPPWTPTPPPPTPRVRGGTTARLGLAAAVLAAALGGGIVGSLLTHRTAATSDASPSTTTTTTRQALTPDEVRAQDVKLCTEYALVNVATPSQPSSPELVAAAAAVRTSLAAHPNASPDLRSALNDVVDTYFATISNRESRGPQGLVDPPKYSQAAAGAAYDRAWALCGLK